jgi:peptidoglycan/xylan/chitin deacetylase (PgdA/CDA1 family)
MNDERGDDGRELSRRSLLRIGAGGLLLSAGLGALDQLVGVPAGAAPASVHAVPAWKARRWHHPIESLVRFEHRMPHVHAPRKAIMLTIDDGPHAEWTPKYLKLLAKYDVHATFCMIGRQIHPLRHIVKDVAEHGHVIANHTWNHDEALTYGSREHIRREIERTTAAIHRAAGVVPTQFRAPGGVWGRPLFTELLHQHLMPLGWNIDPTDWARPGTAAIESAMLKARTHDIILCHDGGGDRSETYHALKKVIPTLLHRGHTFVTLPTLKA